MPPITAWKGGGRKLAKKVWKVRIKTSQSEGGGLTRSLCLFGVIFIGWKKGRNPVVEILCGNSRNQTALFFLSPHRPPGWFTAGSLPVSPATLCKVSVPPPTYLFDFTDPSATFWCTASSTCVKKSRVVDHSRIETTQLINQKFPAVSKFISRILGN